MVYLVFRHIILHLPLRKSLQMLKVQNSEIKITANAQ